MKYELESLFRLPSGRYLPCSLNIWQKFWWRFVPGVTIKIRWPSGPVQIDESMPQWDWTIGPSRYIVDSADPNDHYRPWLEKHVGRQGWDWNWGMADGDVTENRLTLKIRQRHAHYATIAAMRWL